METVATSEESVRDSLDDTMSKMSHGEADEESNNKSSNDSINTCEIALEDWTAITGLRVKLFTEEEKEAFTKPFKLGWKREVVLRGTVTHSGRKISDVYYFLPEKKLKLRSNVETGLYVQRNPDCGLELSDFTFARQPIYHPPEEIVRHAMQKGSNQNANQSFSSLSSSVSTSDMTHLKLPSSTSNSTSSSLTSTPPNQSSTRGPKSSLPDLEADTSGDLSTNLVGGRAKRKRVAPSRFDDEEYEEQSPFKKKSSSEKSSKSSSSTTPTSKQPLRVVAATGKNSIIITTNKAKAEAVRQQAATEMEVVSSKSEPPVKKQQNKVQPRPQPQQQQLQQPLQQQQPPQQPSQTQSQSSASTPSSVSASLSGASEREPLSQNGVSSDELRNHLLQTPEPATLQKQAEEYGECSVTSNILSGLTVTPSTSAASSSNTIPLTSSKATSALTNPSSTSSQKSVNVKPKSASRPASETRINVTKSNKKNGSNQSILTNGSLIPPCSMTCSGLQGALPSILCSRCLCLFHSQCVPGGIRLNQTHQFVCPNCIQPSDQGIKISEENGHLPGSTSVTVQTSSLINSKSKSDNRKSLLEGKSASLNSLNSSRAMNASFKSILQNHGAGPAKPSTNGFVKSRASLGESILTHRQKSQLLLLQHFQQQLGCKPLTSGQYKMNTLPARQMQQQPQHQQQHQHPNSSAVKSQMRLPHIRVDAKDSQSSPQYQAAPIAPIAPIRVTPAQVASILDYKPRPNKYSDYLNKNKPALMRLMGLFDVLSNSFRYLSTKDLISFRQVNRTSRALISDGNNWRKVSLRGLTIKDWVYFGEKIIDRYSTSEVDFDGIRVPSNMTRGTFWREFSNIIDFMGSVRSLKFGSVPSFAITEILNAALVKNCYNSFSELTSLVIKDLYDEDDGKSTNRYCNVSIVQDIHCLTSLTSLSINSRLGLTLQDTLDLADSFRQLSQLTSLTLTNLLHFNVKHFEFLKHLTQLVYLDIGSCESWSKCDEESENSSVESSQSPFKYITFMDNLEHLTLHDLTLNASSTKLLAETISKLPSLKVLSLNSLIIQPDALDSYGLLTSSLNSANLDTFAVKSDDPPTNARLTDLFTKLTCVKALSWKVGTIVEDTGACLVPLAKDHVNEEEDLPIDDDDDTDWIDDKIEMGEIDELATSLRAFLPKTRLIITPS